MKRMYMLSITPLYTAIKTYTEALIPDCVVVQQKQNEPTPVAVKPGDKKVLTMYHERTKKIGSDRRGAPDKDGVSTWHGERELFLTFELFNGPALSLLESLCTMWFMDEHFRLFRAAGFVPVDSEDPKSSTRLHGGKNVPSALVNCRFRTSIVFTENVGLIENVTITGTINDTRNLEINVSKN